MSGVWKSGLVLALFACGVAGEAGAGMLSHTEQRRLISLGRHEPGPMVFFIAKGPADSCGKGCNECWAEKTSEGQAEFEDKLSTAGLQTAINELQSRCVVTAEASAPRAAVEMVPATRTPMQKPPATWGSVKPLTSISDYFKDPVQPDAPKPGDD